MAQACSLIASPVHYSKIPRFVSWKYNNGPLLSPLLKFFESICLSFGEVAVLPTPLVTLFPQIVPENLHRLQPQNFQLCLTLEITSPGKYHSRIILQISSSPFAIIKLISLHIIYHSSLCFQHFNMFLTFQLLFLINHQVNSYVTCLSLPHFVLI